MRVSAPNPDSRGGREAEEADSWHGNYVSCEASWGEPRVS